MKRPYREPASLPAEPPDPEEAAFREIARRARFIRVGVGLPALFVALAAGTAGYIAGRDLMLEALGGSVPYLLGLVAVLPAGIIVWWGSTRLTRFLIQTRAPVWIDALVAKDALDRKALEQFARAL